MDCLRNPFGFGFIFLGIKKRAREDSQKFFQVREVEEYRGAGEYFRLQEVEEPAGGSPLNPGPAAFSKILKEKGGFAPSLGGSRSVQAELRAQ